VEKQHQRFFDFLRFCILIPGHLVILAIMYIMQVVFGMSASLLIVPPNEKYGRFVLNEVLEAGYGTSSGDLNTGDNLSESSFPEALFGLEFGHADFADDADFFAAHLSPITIYWNNSDKLLVIKGTICVTDTKKWFEA